MGIANDKLCLMSLVTLYVFSKPPLLPAICELFSIFTFFVSLCHANMLTLFRRAEYGGRNRQFEGNTDNFLPVFVLILELDPPSNND